MSYIALARKWRPQTFSELLGQQHLVTALENSLNNNRLHHAYLFTGTRGVGKTSVARVLAKALNCEQGISSHPCLKCSSCTALAEGRFIDLIEIDGASKTKVEDTRELLENVQYAPTVGRFKIYLIDEVHMLSQHSFNALLKTLEEPPNHVKFILATTDPEKLPVTVLSRCLQFTLRNVSEETICAQLAKILLSENIKFEEQALKLLATAANGSMRDALSLLDQAIAGCNNNVNSVDVKNILGYTQQNYAAQIMRAIITKKPEEFFVVSKKIHDEGGLFIYVIDNLINMLHKMAIAQILNSQTYLEDIELHEFSTQIAAEDLQLLYQIALKGRDDMLIAPAPIIGFEMLLLRMYTFTPLSKQNFDDEPSLKTKDTSSTNTATEINNFLHKSSADSVYVDKHHAELQYIALHEHTPPSDQLKQIAAGLEFPKKPISTFGDIEPQNAKAHSAYVAIKNWHELIPQLNIRGLSLTAAENSIVEKFENNTYYLVTDKAHESLFNKTVITSLEKALSDFHDLKIIINLKVDQKTNLTPAEIKQQVAAKNLQEATDALEKDSFFQRLQDEFSAELIKNSIVSLKDKA